MRTSPHSATQAERKHFYNVQMPPPARPQRPAVLPRADSRTEPFFRTRTPFREPSLPPPKLRHANRRVASSIYAVPSSQAIDRIAFDAPAVPPLPSFPHQQQGRRLSPVPIVEIVHNSRQGLDSDFRGPESHLLNDRADTVRRKQPMKVLTRSGKLLCADPTAVPSRLMRRNGDEDLRRSLPVALKACEPPTAAVDDKIADRGKLFREGLMRVEARVTKYDPVSRYLYENRDGAEMVRNACANGSELRNDRCEVVAFRAPRPVRPPRASAVERMAVELVPIERGPVKRDPVERMPLDAVPTESIPDHHLFNPQTTVAPLPPLRHRAATTRPVPPATPLRGPSLVRRLSNSVKRMVSHHRDPSRANEMRKIDISPPIIPRPQCPQRSTEVLRGPAGSCEISRGALPLRQLPVPVPDTTAQLHRQPRVVGRGSRETCFSDFLRARPSPPPLPLANAPWTLKEQYSWPEFMPRPLSVAGVAGVGGTPVFGARGNDTVEDLIESYRYLGESAKSHGRPYGFGGGKEEMVIDAYDRGSHASFFLRKRMV